MLEGMAFLHDECKIIHTDLKPENVLLVEPLLKMPKLPKLKTTKATKDDANLTAEERKKLKKKNKRKKQKQKKEGVATPKEDVVAQKEVVVAQEETELVEKVAQLTLDQPTFEDPFLKHDVQGEILAKPKEMKKQLQEFLVDARTSRNYTIPSDFAMRIMILAPPQFMSNAIGVPNRVYRFKLRIPTEAAKRIPVRLYSTDAANKYNAFAAAVNGSASNVPQADLWRFELDSRYMASICSFFEPLLGIALVNISKQAPYVAEGFHYSYLTTEQILQGIALSTPRPLLKISERCGMWQHAAEERFKEQLVNVPKFDVKIADLGNACWTYKHFTQDIQTRQYRSPEVLLGQNYDQSTDMWSMACFIFELATGELLFDPKSGKNYSRDEDHLAQMIELLGKMPKSFATSGKYCKDYFNRKGELKKISNLKFWALKDVLIEKYELAPQEAEEFAAFLQAMMKFIPCIQTCDGSRNFEPSMAELGVDIFTSY
ncbi:serine/threonine-protein kinase [Thraustotheca clavata]|uniref:non-specific serine/threonine protein kinase n=1 Tax=Thraustotheca clavata TaxID=74557 RepID=A0A1V9ZCP6_9STRA|nr:serine/threonine-protein kinase [Thraustotheca clavata]